MGLRPQSIPAIPMPRRWPLARVLACAWLLYPPSLLSELCCSYMPRVAWEQRPSHRLTHALVLVFSRVTCNWAVDMPSLVFWWSMPACFPNRVERPSHHLQDAQRRWNRNLRDIPGPSTSGSPLPTEEVLGLCWVLVFVSFGLAPLVLRSYFGGRGAPPQRRPVARGRWPESQPFLHGCCTQTAGRFRFGVSDAPGNGWPKQ